MDELDKILERVDHATPGPGERAAYVWELLQHEHPELTDWDVVCFAANFLGYMSPALPWLHEDAKHICNLVYKAHYLNGDKIDTASAIKRGTDRVLPQHNEESGSAG